MGNARAHFHFCGHDLFLTGFRLWHEIRANSFKEIRCDTLSSKKQEQFERKNKRKTKLARVFSVSID